MRDDLLSCPFCGGEAEILSCPFCGGEAEILHYQIDGYLPKCKLCDGMIEQWFLIKEEAIAAWNHRTPVKEGEK